MSMFISVRITVSTHVHMHPDEMVSLSQFVTNTSVTELVGFTGYCPVRITQIICGRNVHFIRVHIDTNKIRENNDRVIVVVTYVFVLTQMSNFICIHIDTYEIRQTICSYASYCNVYICTNPDVQLYMRAYRYR